MSESYTVAARLNMASNVPEVIAQLMRGFGQVNTEIKELQDRFAAFANEMREMASSSRGIGQLAATMKELSGIRVGTAAIEDVQRMSTLTRELTEQQEQLAAATRETAGAWRQMAQSSARVAHGAAIGPHAPGGIGGYGTAAGGRGGAWPPGTAAWAVGPNAPGGAGGGGAGGGPPGAPGAAQPGRRQHAPAHVDWMGGAYALQAGGEAGTSFLERSINAEMEVEQQLMQFRMNTTIKDADMQRIRARAEGLAHSIPGTTIAENLHTILDAYTVTGTIGEALAGSEAMAKLNYFLQNMPGQHHGDQAFAGAQAVELMQRFYNKTTHQVDMAAMNQQLAAMAQTVAGTGGRADPSMYLGFAKQSRIGGMVANDQFLYRDLPAMLIALGGSRAGTGEAATFQQFITGTMTKNAANALKSAGLLNQNAVWKGGRVQDMGKNFHGLDVYAQNPVEWVREFMLDPKNGVLAQHHVDPNDRIAMARFLSSWSARQTGLGFMAEMTLGMGGINKESTKIAQTTTNPLGVMQQFDPYQKLREFNAAENELLVTLGQGAIGPALEALKGLTSVLRDMTDWAKAHPNAAKDLMLVGGGLSVLAKAAGDAGMVIFLGAPLVGGLRALAAAVLPFGSGGSAAAAIATAAGGAGVAGSLGALVAAIIALPPALKLAADGVMNLLGMESKKDWLKDRPDSSHGNYFFDWLHQQWQGFMNAPAPSLGHGNGGGRGPGGQNPENYGRRPASFTVDPSSLTNPPGNMTMNFQGNLVTPNGEVLGRYAGQAMARDMQHPQGGTTGGDLRADPWSLGLGMMA